MTTARTLESPLTAFRRAYDARFAEDGSWLASHRAAAFDRFVETGISIRQTEGWRHLDLSPLEEFEIRHARPEHAPITEADLRFALESAVGPLADSTLSRLETLRLVFVDGWFAPGLSALDSLAANPWARLLANSSAASSTAVQGPNGPARGAVAQTGALESQRSHLEPSLSERSRILDTPFALLNNAFFQDGVFLRIPKGTQIPFVIHLVHVTTRRATASHPRHVFVVESGASVGVVSDHVSMTSSAGGGTAASASEVETAGSVEVMGRDGALSSSHSGGPRYLSNPVLQIHLEDDAEMNLYKLVREHERTYHLGVTSVLQERGSRFTAFSLVRGGRLVRQDLECRQNGPGAESVLHGLNVLCGTQIADDHTTMVHAQPHGSSRELYKTILDDQAEGVFHGKVIVEQSAVGTNARQSSKNLLLSTGAIMNTEPQLEISTDDVKCGHGATIGQLDPEALFYLRSRGLEENAARALLTQAFASDIVAAIPEETVRELVQGYLTFPLCRRPGRTVPRTES